jgi:VanZ family protein
MPPLPRSSRFWFGCFSLWFAVLWVFSSLSFPGTAPPPIPHLDKVQHFGYFLGGGGLFCAALYRRNPECPNWRKIIATTVLALALAGGIDELHQGFTPGRSGNDFYDWLADLAGALTGSLIFKRIHRRLKWVS